MSSVSIHLCSSRRFQSLTGQENFVGANGTSGSSSGLTASEVDLLKQELLVEVRLEIQKAKQEIIEGECL